MIKKLQLLLTKVMFSCRVFKSFAQWNRKKKDNNKDKFVGLSKGLLWFLYETGPNKQILIGTTKSLEMKNNTHYTQYCFMDRSLRLNKAKTISSTPTNNFWLGHPRSKPRCL